MKTKSGISLIVLVITVVVLIILAASIILLVNESKIVKNADKAVKASDSAKAKEVALMAKTDWRTNQKQIRNEGWTTFKAYAESRLAEAGFAVGDNAGEFMISDSGQLYEYKAPVVPKGFVSSSVETENEISEGFVIYEGREKVTEENAEIAKKTRNQFVWIPVPNINEFKVKEGYSSGSPQKHVFLKEVSEPGLRSILELTNSDIQTGEYAEYNAMKASIEKYGGFYIGRYETGTTTPRINVSNETSLKEDRITPDIFVQKEKPVYNYVGWGSSMTKIDDDVTNANDTNSFNQGKGAVVLARNMYTRPNEDGEILSHLVYGTEWDAILDFIDDQNIIKNSSINGNYANYNDSVEEENKIDGAGTIKVTGSSENWKIKNIYDLAGNVREWTMEAFHGALIGRTTRGGAADMTGLQQPVSNRLANIPSYSDEAVGFRVALYLK